MVMMKLTDEQKIRFKGLEDPTWVNVPNPVKDAEFDNWKPPPGTIVKNFVDLEEPITLLGYPKSLKPSPKRPPPLGPDFLGMRAPEPEPEPEQEDVGEAMEVDEEEEDEDEDEPIVLPVKRGVRVIRQFVATWPREEVFRRPAAVAGDRWEVECCAAIGRTGRQGLVFCLKWKGWPWSSASWEKRSNVSDEMLDELEGVWGPLDQITADSRPLADDDEDDDEEDARPSKRARRV